MTETDLNQLIAKARAAYEAMTPTQKADHDYAQRRSFVRGMCPDNVDFAAWCANVDRLLPVNGRAQQSDVVLLDRINGSLPDAGRGPYTVSPWESGMWAIMTTGKEPFAYARNSRDAVRIAYCLNIVAESEESDRRAAG